MCQFNLCFYHGLKHGVIWHKMVLTNVMFSVTRWMTPIKFKFVLIIHTQLHAMINIESEIHNSSFFYFNLKTFVCSVDNSPPKNPIYLLHWLGLFGVCSKFISWAGAQGNLSSTFPFENQNCKNQRRWVHLALKKCER